MTVGKLWYEAETRNPADAAGATGAHELVLVDGPATGHSLQYLRMPQAALEAFPSGLVHREAERVVGLLRDSEATGVVVVTTAEEMPTNETFDMVRGLGELQMHTALLVVNQVHEAPCGREELDGLPVAPVAPLESRTRAGRGTHHSRSGAAARRDRGARARGDRLGGDQRGARRAPGGGDRRADGQAALPVQRGVRAPTRSAGSAARSHSSSMPDQGERARARDGSRTVMAARTGTDVAELVREHRIVVCAGSGGVGKTTTAATIALWGALQGRNAIVLTIDPARRLADSLGVGPIGNTPVAVPESVMGGARARGARHLVGDDARPEGELGRAGRAPRAEPRGAPAHPRQPLLPAALAELRRVPGVHGGRAARRARRQRTLRPDRRRHAADAARARLPRGPRAPARLPRPQDRQVVRQAVVLGGLVDAANDEPHRRLSAPQDRGRDRRLGAGGRHRLLQRHERPVRGLRAARTARHAASTPPVHGLRPGRGSRRAGASIRRTTSRRRCRRAACR